MAMLVLSSASHVHQLSSMGQLAMAVQCSTVQSALASAMLLKAELYSPAICETMLALIYMASSSALYNFFCGRVEKTSHMSVFMLACNG